MAGFGRRESKLASQSSHFQESVNVHHRFFRDNLFPGRDRAAWFLNQDEELAAFIQAVDVEPFSETAGNLGFDLACFHVLAIWFTDADIVDKPAR